MKNKNLMLIGLLACSSAFAQTDDGATGLPGDNFSLEGALDLFKKSESPESFERMLNEEENKVNNLDLNGDGQTDYIRVIDRQEGDVHAFVLQDVVAENEDQDIAVIEVEKNGNDDATVQIVGDEDLYGQQRIVEPREAVKSYGGTQTSNVVVNVWTWPAVRYVYTPSYRMWVSPWGWRARPVWWRPWQPVRYHVYHAYYAPYRPHYVVVHHHRTIHAHHVYTPVRRTSVIVRTRYQEPVQRYRSAPRTTRSRSTTVSPSHTTESNKQISKPRSRSTTVSPSHTTESNKQISKPRSRSSTARPSRAAGSSKQAGKTRSRSRD